EELVYFDFHLCFLFCVVLRVFSEGFLRFRLGPALAGLRRTFVLGFWLRFLQSLLALKLRVIAGFTD
ncbi:MAG: hypothetical protein DMF26_18180, partial [Verrucomicrobia bacterium]